MSNLADSLRSNLEVGSGWTLDQQEQRSSLEKERDFLASKLENRTAQVNGVRTDADRAYEAIQSVDAEIEAQELKVATMEKKIVEYMKQATDSKVEGGHAKKIDIIINGIETIGSAQRSSDPEEMRKFFYEISDGGYAKIIFDKFSKERVEEELNEFLALDFFDRSGGGIGITRLIRVMKENQLLD